jgi:hypothetical protein
MTARRAILLALFPFFGVCAGAQASFVGTPPYINSMTPHEGPAGSTLHIYGQGLTRQPEVIAPAPAVAVCFVYPLRADICTSSFTEGPSELTVTVPAHPERETEAEVVVITNTIASSSNGHDAWWFWPSEGPLGSPQCEHCGGSVDPLPTTPEAPPAPAYALTAPESARQGIGSAQRHEAKHRRHRHAKRRRHR